MLRATELEFVPFVNELMTFPPIPPAIALPNRSAIIFVNGQKSHLLKSLLHFCLKSVLALFYFLTDTQDTPRKVSKRTDWCGPAVVAFSLTSNFGNAWASQAIFLSQISISPCFYSNLLFLIFFRGVESAVKSPNFKLYKLNSQMLYLYFDTTHVSW